MSLSGVQIYTAFNRPGVDPFYPAKYGGVRFPASVLIDDVDHCLAHPSPHGSLHYHSASPCLANIAEYEALMHTDYDGDPVETMI